MQFCVSGLMIGTFGGVTLWARVAGGHHWRCRVPGRLESRTEVAKVVAEFLCVRVSTLSYVCWNLKQRDFRVILATHGYVRKFVQSFWRCYGT